MNFIKFAVIVLSILPFISNPLLGGSYRVISPDGRITVTVTTGNKIYYSVNHDEQRIIIPSPISVKIEPGIILGSNPQVTGTRSRSVNTTLKPVVKQKNAVINNRFNELSLSFKGGYGLIFRVYNDAAAWMRNTK